MKFALFAVAALMTAALCGCSTSAEKTKTLVLYYSQTGATKAVAEELQSQPSCDERYLVLKGLPAGIISRKKSVCYLLVRNRFLNTGAPPLFHCPERQSLSASL